MASRPVPAPRRSPVQGLQGSSPHRYDYIHTPPTSQGNPPTHHGGPSAPPTFGTPQRFSRRASPPDLHPNPAYAFHNPWSPKDMPPPLPPKPRSSSGSGQRLSLSQEVQRSEQAQGLDYGWHQRLISDPAQSSVQGYPATAGEGTFVSTGQQQRPSSVYVPGRQKDDEIHHLRLALDDRDQRLATMSSELERCHIENQHLQRILAEKKESLIRFEQRMGDLQTENDTLRQIGLATSLQPSNQYTSHTEQALQEDIRQLRQQLTESQQQIDQLRAERFQLQRVNASAAFSPTLPPNHPSSQGATMELRRKTEEHDRERARLSREIENTRSEVAVLNHQVRTYKEDFETERQDRERAQHKIHTLKEENESLIQAINMLAAEHNIQLDAYGIAAQRNQL